MAIALPVTALLVRMFVWPTPPRWSPFYVAVFLASWLGGLIGGLGATAVSAVLVWVFLVEPTHMLFKQNPSELGGAAIFITVGVGLSVLHGRLRRPNERAAVSMDALRRVNEQLHGALDELEAANRRAEQTTRSLVESQRFLQAILDYSPSGIVIKDLEGRFLLINRRLEEQLGIQAGEMKGKTDFDLFPREVAERNRANDEQVLRTAAPVTIEKTAELRDGTHVFLASEFPLHDDAGNIFAVCEISSDITAHTRAEEALRQTAVDLRAAQGVAHVGSWSWDPATDTARWSDELYRIFGRDPSQPLPKVFGSDMHLFTADSLARVRAAIQKTLRDGTPYEVELEVPRPDGTTRWVSARGEPVRGPDGKIVSITGTAQDITELKALQRLREEWTSVIAHDLRQPLGAITMAAEFLASLDARETDEKQRVLIERIRSAARGLTRMVDDLLDLSLLEANRLKLERRWVDPRTLVQETLERLAHVTNGTRIETHSAPNVPEVCADTMRIGQVLGNLISNAMKYGDPSRPIEISIDHRGAFVEIAVTNEGHGIAAEELPKIFGRFMRSDATRAKAPGLGVGLYIAKGLVEAHGGKMWVESTPGKRTTFHLTLPARESKRAAA